MSSRASADFDLALPSAGLNTWALIADRQWHPGAQKVIAVPLDLPETPEGHSELSQAEILSTVEPTDVNHVWVASRLSGSEDVVSLRSSS